MASREYAGDDYDHLYKIILVGDATVGKTHILSRYTRGTLPKEPRGTIGVEFATHIVPLAVGGTVKAQVWDTAGQEKYRSITQAHYRRSVGALLVYDITRRQTFLNCLRWLDDIRQSAEPDIVVMLVGNKLDLVDGNANERQVPIDEAEKMAADNGMLFLEASAVTTHNIKKMFEYLLQEIYSRKKQIQNYNLPEVEGPGVGRGVSPVLRTFANPDAAMRLDVPAEEEKQGCC